VRFVFYTAILEAKLTEGQLIMTFIDGALIPSRIAIVRKPILWH